MDVRRADSPWVAPTGTGPGREPGDPGFGVLAALHLGMLFALSAVAALLAPTVDQPSLTAAGGAAAVAAVTAAVAVAALRRDHPVSLWVADFCFAASAAYLALTAATVALVAGSSGRTALLAGAAAGGTCAALVYVVLRRVWLQVATVAGLATSLLALVAGGEGVPDPVAALFLLIIAGFVAAGALSGAVRPIGSGYVLAALVGLAGAQVLLTGTAGVGYLAPVVVLAAVGALLVRTGSASLLPVLAIGGVVLLPQVLGPLFGGARAFGLSVVGVGAGVAWLAVDVQRRSVRPQHTGGVFLLCSLLVLVAAPILLAQSDALVALLAGLGLAAFFAAAATAGRRPATVLSGLLLVLTVPQALVEPLRGGSELTVVAQLGLAAAAIAAAVLLDGRAARPQAATGDGWLSAPGADALLDAPYPQVFDTTVRLLGGAGLALQLVDRAAGRVLAGPAQAPVLGVAVWQSGPVTTSLRVVGVQADTERFLRDLRAELAPRSVPGGPH